MLTSLDIIQMLYYAENYLVFLSAGYASTVMENGAL